MRIFALICSDVVGYGKKENFVSVLALLCYKKGFQISFWLRISQFMNNIWAPLALLPKVIYYLIRIIYCVDLPTKTRIGKSFAIHHCYGLVVHPRTIIGDNVSLSHQVTIGNKSIFEKDKTPIIGNNVYVAPGAKIIGNVRIGDNTIIGANCVVTKDVPPNHVAVGIPNKNILRKDL